MSSLEAEDNDYYFESDNDDEYAVIPLLFWCVVPLLV